MDISNYKSINRSLRGKYEKRKIIHSKLPEKFTFIKWAEIKTDISSRKVIFTWGSQNKEEKSNKWVRKCSPFQYTSVLLSCCIMKKTKLGLFFSPPLFFILLPQSQEPHFTYECLLVFIKYLALSNCLCKYEIFFFTILTCFTIHNSFQLFPFYCKWQIFTFLYGWIVFHCVAAQPIFNLIPYQ